MLENHLKQMYDDVKNDLISKTEEELQHELYWDWDPNSTHEWNTYKFFSMLDIYRRRCRIWEEHHNGSYNVVERVRDKYLMAKIEMFLQELKNADETTHL